MQAEIRRHVRHVAPTVVVSCNETGRGGGDKTPGQKGQWDTVGTKTPPQSAVANGDFSKLKHGNVGLNGLCTHKSVHFQKKTQITSRSAKLKYSEMFQVMNLC